LPIKTQSQSDEEEPPAKAQRITGKKRANLHRSEEDHTTSSGTDTATAMRIAALERDNQLQEQRICTYVTKLESSAREVSNLQRELHEFREKVQEKDDALSEERQNMAAVESARVALEARCRGLDDSIAHLKTQVGDCDMLCCVM
jgi:chromosome segregation ATPase